jgi:hypothetical protein
MAVLDYCFNIMFQRRCWHLMLGYFKPTFELFATLKAPWVLLFRFVLNFDIMARKKCVISDSVIEKLAMVTPWYIC